MFKNLTNGGMNVANDTLSSSVILIHLKEDNEIFTKIDIQPSVKKKINWSSVAPSWCRAVYGKSEFSLEIVLMECGSVRFENLNCTFRKAFNLIFKSFGNVCSISKH